MLDKGDKSGPNKDITPQKQVEKDLWESQARLRLALDASGIALWDAEVNAAGLAAFGYTREEAIGRTPLELNLWADPVERDRYLHLLRTEGSKENSFLRGSNLWPSILQCPA